VLFPGSSGVVRKFEVRVEELPEGRPVPVGPATVSAYEVVHACGAPPYALRVELDGRVVAYSGDTEWTDRLLAVAAGADLFICEAYFYDKRVPFHLDHATLMRHRSHLGCKRLILTHMSADMLAHLPETAECAAEDGFEVSI
jgi:ribonuclease BN (tRNA processing enzyme)